MKSLTHNQHVYELMNGDHASGLDPDNPLAVLATLDPALAAAAHAAVAWLVRQRRAIDRLAAETGEDPGWHDEQTLQAMQIDYSYFANEVQKLARLAAVDAALMFEVQAG